MHVIAAKAVAFREAMTDEFRADQQATVDNARVLAASSPTPAPRSSRGGTDNHLMLVDVRPLGVNGKEADAALGEVRITVNKNTIPYDPEKPMIGSGIRVGTPAVTVARHARGRDARDRRADRRRDRGARRRVRAGGDPPAGGGDHRPLPGSRACRGRASAADVPA